MDPRQKRRESLMGKNEFKIEKNIQPIPGQDQKGNVLNNFDVGRSFNPQMASMDGKSPFPYSDMKEMMPQMGVTINPMSVPRSKLNQNTPVAGRGFQSNQPFNAPVAGQPDISGRSPQADMMQSGLYTQRIPDGLPKGPMGLQGMPALPGSINPMAPGTSGPDLMPGNGGIVPGSTPQKIGQKKKGGKK